MKFYKLNFLSYVMKKHKEKRPWGGFERFTSNEKSTVKILTIKPKQEFSLQYHKKRKEFWRFLDNPAEVTLGKKIIKAKKGDEFFIMRGIMHRIKAFSKEVNVLEIAFGSFDENDVIRVEDRYGRA